MQNPRKARVSEQHFLNLPGFYGGAYVRAYAQVTTDEAVRQPEGKRAGYVPTPCLELEIADCDHRIRLEFDIQDADDRLNSFFKINALINALEAFKDGMAEEAALRRARLRELEGLQADERAHHASLSDAPAFGPPRSLRSAA